MKECRLLLPLPSLQGLARAEWIIRRVKNNRSPKSKRKGSQAPRTKRARNNVNSLSSAYPRTIDQNPVFTRIFRYQATSALVGVAIPASALLNLLHVAKTTTTSACVFSAIKLHHLEVYGAPAVGPTPSSVNVAWFGTHALPRRVTDTGTLQAPAHLRCGPSKGSFTSMWQLVSAADTTNTMFVLSVGAGAIIDIHLSYAMQEPSSGVKNLTTAGATAGTMYYNYLDNTTVALATGANLLSPLGEIAVAPAFG